MSWNNVLDSLPKATEEVIVLDNCNDIFSAKFFCWAGWYNTKGTRVTGVKYWISVEEAHKLLRTPDDGIR